MNTIRTPSGATLRSLTVPLNATGTSPLPVGGSIVMSPSCTTQRLSLRSQLSAVTPPPASRGVFAIDAACPDSDPRYTSPLPAVTMARYFPSGDTAAMDTAGRDWGWMDGRALDPSGTDLAVLSQR